MQGEKALENEVEAEKCIPLCLCVMFPPYSSVDRHLDCFHFLNFVNKAAINMDEQLSLWFVIKSFDHMSIWFYFSLYDESSH